MVPGASKSSQLAALSYFLSFSPLLLPALPSSAGAAPVISDVILKIHRSIYPIRANFYMVNFLIYLAVVLLDSLCLQ